mgnify:CR=1 FL=1
MSDADFPIRYSPRLSWLFTTMGLGRAAAQRSQAPSSFIFASTTRSVPCGVP